MINGLGVDIVCITEFENLVKEEVSVFLQKHFTAAEIHASETKSGSMGSHLAARFAAKEALVKALDSSYLFRPKQIPHVNYTDIEICNDPEGRPYFIFHGDIKEHVERLNENILLSMSHDGDYAIAEVIVSE